VWEIRGWTFRNAANAVPNDNGRTNLTSVAVLHALPGLVLDPNGYAVDELDDAQLEAVHDLLGHVTEVCGRTLTVTSHARLEPTGCPGIGIARQLAAGKLALPTPPTPAPATLLTTVQPGDGWWSIARRVYGTATPALVDVLATANGRRAIHPGQHITVPGRATYP
jgi:nucleoid-associated protein YgaU